MSTYERKTPEDLDCGVNVFMKVFGGKWKPCIIYLLHLGFKRPSELHKQMKGATPRVIDMQLSELETFGMVCKEVKEGFPLRVDYSLTEKGRSAIAIIKSMDKWGELNAAWVKEINNSRQRETHDLVKQNTCGPWDTE
jgi:DNA-binding HxlR family transcriptional regulator